MMTIPDNAITIIIKKDGEEYAKCLSLEDYFKSQKTFEQFITAMRCTIDKLK